MAPTRDAASELEVAPRQPRSLVLIALANQQDRAPADLVQRFQRDGAVVYQTHGFDGCLRVATAVRPARIVLDPRMSPRLIRLLRAHPRTATATLDWLSLSRSSITPS